MGIPLTLLVGFFMPITEKIFGNMKNVTTFNP